MGPCDSLALRGTRSAPLRSLRIQEVPATFTETNVTTTPPPNRYADLVQPHKPNTSLSRNPRPEEQLDSLIKSVKERQCFAEEGDAITANPLQCLRQLMINELIPTFVELVEKYSKSGMSLQMDASNFLEGGREIRFEFGIGEYRSQLLGTVTTEAIAFHETRYSPEVHGEFTSGPMLRLRYLDAEQFRDFICERLTVLLRDATRRR